MSFPAMSWAVRQQLPCTQKMVLIMLADRHNSDTGQCNPSHDRLAVDCGLSKRAVIDQISKLAILGLVKIVHRVKANIKLPNHYTLMLSLGTKEVVNELHYPSAGGALPVVQEVHYPSAAAALPQCSTFTRVVQELQEGSAGGAHKPVIEPVIEPTHNTVPVDNFEDVGPSKAGAVCVVLKSEGIPSVNPSHPELLALLATGAEVGVFSEAAKIAVKKGNASFAYVLGIVKRQMQTAAQLATTPLAAPAPAAVTVPGRQGVDPTLAKIIADGLKATKPSAAVRAEMARLSKK